jgi:hypothetical protein
MKKIIIAISILMVLLMLTITAVRAWWAPAHASIDAAAIRILPNDMPSFFRDGGSVIESYSSDPDILRNKATPFISQEEYPNHFLDLELLKGEQLPRDRKSYHDVCGKIGVDPYRVGFLPYAIAEWHDRLVISFAEYRKWPNDKRIQMKIVYIAGILSHYTADASQPLHCTMHYDGRAEDGKPYVRTGIHDKMDALPHQVGGDLFKNIQVSDVRAESDIFSATMAMMHESNKKVDTVYKLESKLPPTTGEIPGGVDENVRSLAEDCSCAGARFTATVWYSAWMNSAAVVLPPHIDEQTELFKREK